MPHSATSSMESIEEISTNHSLLEQLHNYQLLIVQSILVVGIFPATFIALAVLLDVIPVWAFWINSPSPVLIVASVVGVFVDNQHLLSAVISIMKTLYFAGLWGIWFFGFLAFKNLSRTGSSNGIWILFLYFFVFAAFSQHLFQLEDELKLKKSIQHLKQLQKTQMQKSTDAIQIA